jgi:hypothetical protein
MVASLNMSLQTQPTEAWLHATFAPAAFCMGVDVQGTLATGFEIL